MTPQVRSSRAGNGVDGGRTLGELVGTLTTETTDLIRREVALARMELEEAFGRTGKGLGRVAAGAGVALLGGLALAAGAVLLLGVLMGSYWLAALIFGVALLIAAAGTGLAGVKQLRSTDLAPRSTLESLRDSGEWARREVGQVRSSLMGSPGVERDGSVAGAARLADTRAGHARIATSPAPRPAEGTSARSGQPAGGGNAPKPPSGLVPFLKHVGREISEDDVTGQAAKLAYYGFMAMPPALMAVFGLAGLFQSDWLAGWIESQAALALPGAVNDVIIEPFIEQVVLNSAPGPFSIGLLLALFAASSVFVGLMDTLNVAYDVEDDRSFVKKRATALGAMFLGTGLFLLAAVSLLFGPELAKAIGLGRVGELIWIVVRWPLTFGFVVAAFWVGYYLLPNRDQKRCKKVLLKAAAVAALLWVLATALFRIYIANFSSYSETYGFIGAFIILLLWLYVTGLVVLIGGELASEMEKRAA